MNKKKVIIVIFIVILAIIGITFWILNSQEKPQDVLEQYVSLINNHSYKEMYEYLTEEAI